MKNLRYLPDSIVRRVPHAGRFRQAADATLTVASSWLPHGVDVFDREWDVLVILDTCRVDAMEAVADEYDFLAPRDTVWSRGSATREWVAHTFTQGNRAEIRNTALVTANPSSRWALLHEAEPDWPEFSKRLTGWDTVTPDAFLAFDEVWRYGPVNPYSGTVVPEAVTDRAISTWRSLSPDRMIVHYLPPHHPYGSRALRENRPLREFERDPWTALKNGTPRQEVWETYLADLRDGLDTIATLVDDIDADDIVVTADHGELFGEYGLYAHPMLPVPPLRKVPWVRTSGRGRGEYTPQLQRSDESADDLEDEVEEQLEMLGYR
ncbi:hypothetical protein [Halobellus rarus]|uniref:Sulfatase n=1 Tax=Halobellus rarus TaxID=1126237 RepID=A0ABD6CKX7_9EURY|nr:hypothetical protein [Halobellus rarus]